MNNTNRLEAFSDGVLAIIITIMVLELDVPKYANLAALHQLAPILLSYLLSFIYVGIYWNNHHHLFQVTQKISGGILWANLHLLFWLSLFPFATAWLGQNPESSVPAALYGVVLLAAALAWWLLIRLIKQVEGLESLSARSMRNTWKEKVSLLLYLTAISLAFVHPWISDILYGLVALIWIIPDRRIENALEQQQAERHA